jgi:hypothetical protein
MPTRRAFIGGLAALAAATVRRGMAAPPEVLSYFRDKGLRPKFSWLDVFGEEHAHAFTVAGVTETRVLAEFRAGIDKAIVGGWGFDKFRDEMAKRLTPLGWWGPREVADPEGRWKAKTVDFTRPARLQTTFWSNMRAARAAGQWDRAQRTKRALPYFLYLMSRAERKRPEHLRLVGIILPVDHGFWSTYMPPNGWGCLCSVRQISAAERDDYLARPYDDNDPGAILYTDKPPPPQWRTFVNKRTGERVRVPAGIDPGWQTNPGVGRGRTLGRILADQIDATPLDLARGRIERLVESDGFGSHLWRAQSRGAERAALMKDGKTIAEVDQTVPWDHGPMPVARLPDDLAAAIGVARPTVTLTDAAAGHAVAHPYPDWIWARTQEMIERGAIYRRRRDGRTLVVHEIDGRTFVMVLAQAEGDRLTVATLFSNRRGLETPYLARELAGADRIR